MDEDAYGSLGSARRLTEVKVSKHNVAVAGTPRTPASSWDGTYFTNK